jgi:O-antigen/teichoic acid export membrane protein
MLAQAILMIGSKIVAHVAFLLIGVVLARTLTQIEFGTFNQVWLVNKSLLFLFELGLPISVYYFLPRLRDNQKKGFILQTVFSLILFSLPFSAALYLLAGPLAVNFNNPSLADHLRLFAFYPLVLLPSVSTEEILLSLGRVGSAAVFESLSKIVMIVAVAVAAIFGQQLDLVFKSLIIYGIIQTVLGIWLVWQPVKHLKLKFSLSEWRSQLAYAAPYGFSTLAGALNYQVDKVMVSLFNPPAAFAVYAAGAFEIPLGGVTSLPVVSVMMSDLTQMYANGDIKGFLAMWHESMRKLALPVLAVTTFLMVFAEPVVIGLFSAKYAASVWPFRIYLLFSPIRVTVFDYILASLGKTQMILKAQVIAMFANIILGFVLLQTFGWMGAAVSAVLASYLFVGLILNKIRERLEVSWWQVMPWRDLALILLVAIAAALGSFPSLWLSVAGFWQIIVGFAIYLPLYLLGNLVTKAITIAEIKMALAMGMKKVRSLFY